MECQLQWPNNRWYVVHMTICTRVVFFFFFFFFNCARDCDSSITKIVILAFRYSPLAFWSRIIVTIGIALPTRRERRKTSLFGHHKRATNHVAKWNKNSFVYRKEICHEARSVIINGKTRMLSLYCISKMVCWSSVIESAVLYVWSTISSDCCLIIIIFCFLYVKHNDTDPVRHQDTSFAFDMRWKMLLQVIFWERGWRFFNKLVKLDRPYPAVMRLLWCLIQYRQEIEKWINNYICFNKCGERKMSISIYSYSFLFNWKNERNFPEWIFRLVWFNSLETFFFHRETMILSWQFQLVQSV